MGGKWSIFQIVILAAFGAFAVAGVLIFSFLVSGGNTNAVGPVSLWGTFDSQKVESVLRTIADRDSNFSEVTYVQKPAATFLAEVAQGLASGTGPDLIIVRSDEARAAAALVEPIPYERLSRERFLSTFVAGASPFLAPVGVLGAPVVADPLVLYWDRDAFATAGIASAPTYWDEMQQMVPRLTAKSDSGAITHSAIAIGEYVNIRHAKLVLSTLIFQAGGTITAENAEGVFIPALDNVAALSALRFYTEFADPARSGYTWSRAMPEAQSAFVSGAVAMYIGLASEEDAIRAANPNLNFSVAAIPQVRNSYAISGGYVYAIAMPRARQNVAGAPTIMAELASRDSSILLAEALGIASAQLEALKVQAERESAFTAAEALVIRSWADPSPAKTEAIFRAMIEDVTSGTQLLPDAVSRARERLGVIQP